MLIKTKFLKRGCKGTKYKGELRKEKGESCDFVEAIHLPTWFPVGIYTYKNYKM
jgi:hypothetical protein